MAKHRGYYESDRNLIIEVHPAVSMGMMWLDSSISEPFPIYKKSRDARKVIVENLKFPNKCIESDDILDAYVAYLMAKQFMSNFAMNLYDPVKGSYVLPKGKSFDELMELTGTFMG